MPAKPGIPDCPARQEVPGRPARADHKVLAVSRVQLVLADRQDNLEQRDQLAHRDLLESAVLLERPELRVHLDRKAIQELQEI